MRMKKLMILATCAAIAAVACTKIHEVTPVTQGPEIGFGTWTNTMTKAPRTSTFVNGETFAVYGTKTTASVTKGVVFKNQAVTYASSGDAWSYNPIRYWDPTATNYTFYAVMPSTVSLAAETATDDYPKSGIFKSNEITFAAPPATITNLDPNDILVADEYSRDPVAGVLPTGPVQLTFNHIASLIDVKVKKDAALPATATLSITAAELRNIRTKGTFEVKSYNNTTHKPVIGTTAAGWEPDATPTTGTYISNATLPMEVTNKTTYNTVTGVAGDTTDSAETPATVVVPTGLQSLFTQFVLMPQALNPESNKPKLYIAYDIITSTSPEVKTSYTKEILLTDFVVTDNINNPAPSASTAWVPGVHYTYTLTINAKAITFEAQVADWTDNVNGYHYLVQ